MAPWDRSRLYSGLYFLFWKQTHFSLFGCMYQQGRVQAAKNMVEKLRQDAHVRVFVKEMEVLCDAFIQLANWNVSQYKTETSKFF